MHAKRSSQARPGAEHHGGSRVERTPRAIERMGASLELTELAKREGNAKKPIYQMHKWWARRLGVNFRWLLLGSMAPGPTRASTLWKRFFSSDEQQELVVLDPFMGGGTSVVEATKLGAKVIGVDIDPVAWFVVSQQITATPRSEVQVAMEHLGEKVGSRIKSLYRTSVADCEYDIVYAFWALVVPCASCGHEFEGHIHHKLYDRKDAAGPTYPRMAFCSACHQPAPFREGQKTFTCTCSARTNIEEGTLLLGKYKCPQCKHSGHLHSLPDKALPLPERLFAIEYWDPAKGHTVFKAADDEDRRRFKAAQDELERLQPNLPLPRREIPKNRSDPRPVSFGHQEYADLFNDRQLLSLAVLYEEIIKIENTDVRKFLTLAFSDCLAANNRYCSYAFGYQKLTPLFGLHAYRRVTRPVEGNVWGTDRGRGSFVSCVNKAIRGLEFAEKPYEVRYPDGGREVIETGQIAQAQVVDSWQSLQEAEGRAAWLKAHDSRDLSWIPDDSVDVILTDPPYYDNLAYSELSDFYRAWLELTDVLPAGPESDSVISKSLFVPRRHEHPDDEYITGMTAVFSHCRRVLKPNGLVVLTFHHVRTKAWSALASAFSAAGLEVVHCFPVLSEGKSGFHSAGGNIKWDCVLVLRPRESGQAYQVEAAREWTRRRTVAFAEELAAETRFGPADRRGLALGLAASYATQTTATRSEIEQLLGIVDAHLSNWFPGHPQGRQQPMAKGIKED